MAQAPPESFDFIMLGGLYEKMLRYPQAIDSYKQAVVIDLKNDLAHYRLGELYLRIGNRELAEEKYRFLRSLKSRFADKLLKEMNKP